MKKILIATIAFFATTQLSAQRYKWFRVGITSNHYVGDIANAKNMAGVNWAVSKEISDKIQFTGEFYYNKLAATDEKYAGQTDNIFGRPAPFKTSTGGMNFLVSYDFFNTYDSYFLTPYVETGVGLMYYNVYPGHTTAIIPAGVGLRCKLTDKIAATLSSRYNFSFSDKLDNYSWDFTKKADGSIQTSLGIAFRFSK